MLILDSDPTTAETPLPLGTFATLHSGGADRSLRVRKPSSSSCTRAEQSHSLLSLSRGAPGIPCWTRAPGMQPRARACHAHAALAPKATEAARGQPPLDLLAPGRSLATGGELDAALPGGRQVRTHVLKGCGNSSAICPPFLLPAWDLDVLGEPLIHRHHSKPCAGHPLMPLF